MYDRYGDILKFITDEEQLCAAKDGYVYISGEKIMILQSIWKAVMLPLTK